MLGFEYHTSKLRDQCRSLALDANARIPVPDLNSKEGPDDIKT